LLKKIFRLVIAAVGALFGFGAYQLSLYLIRENILKLSWEMTEWNKIIFGVACVVIFALISFSMAPLLNRQSKKVARDIEMELQAYSTNELVAGTAGLTIGLIIAFLISKIYEGIEIAYLPTILSVITYLLLGYLGVIIATRKGKDLVASLVSSRRISSVGGKTGKAKHQDLTPKIFDTSVIIDGRIADIMKTGFIEGNIVIPEFVLVELRHIADSSDALKRNRGRRGLDILNKMQSEYGIDIYNTTGEKSLDEIPEVDVKLLKLAQIMHGKVVTNDFNLNKVAAIKGVEVLNINELANALKPVVLPGEDMTLFLVKEGKEQNQAVAYLDDGTMIVVEDGRRHIGSTINVTVTSVLQTAAGRMIFGKPSKR
jgi:uncharacterized protein YacL